MSNLWHSLSIEKELLGVVEMSKGSQLKYEIDKTSGALVLDRIIKTPVPANYGFIPRTLSDDGDALDVFIYSSFALEPLSAVKIKVERVIHAFDGDAGDAKLIATVVGDNLNWTGVDKRVEATIDYLQTYKKGMKIVGVLDHKTANTVIGIAKSNYNRKFIKELL